ncbi:MAG: TatD family hydrolase [Thermomicrobiales bacterium]
MTTEPSPRAFVDTHVHLDDDQFVDDVDDVLDRARIAGVNHVINIGYSPARWATSMRLAARHPMVSYTLGVHPNHANEWNAATSAELESLLDTTRAVAVGEIGIDLYRDGVPLAVQRKVFDAQLRLAAQQGLPVVIHQRAAEAEVIDVLSRMSPSLMCVFHSFEGSARLAQFGQDRGYFFGIGGLMTRQGSAALRDVLSRIKCDRLLLETDSPYLIPAGVKNRRNEPANIPLIAEKLADLRSISISEVQRITTINAHQVFGLPAGSSTAR